MKSLLIVSLCVFNSLLVFGQKKAKDDASNQIYSELKGSLHTDWIRENPKLVDTKSSFFNQETAKQYVIAPVKISGVGVPFVWDTDMSILKFLGSKSSDFKKLSGRKADPDYKGVKIVWNAEMLGTIWISDNIYKAQINNWHLIAENDCPGTIAFPTLSFEKIPNGQAASDEQEGLAIIPFNEKIKKICSSPVQVKSKAGVTYGGTAYDVNNDKINDLLLLIEEIDELTIYKRLYMNVEGRWECQWVQLDEECV